tara:strand:+ start:73592 stop:74914 length:1323 start_codon:yes stop_codon:yes gene_type:complete
MIALLDCNNFYVSCERLFNPKLINRPVIVLSNNDGCIISRSNEAKELGIKMGEPFFMIKKKIDSMNIKVCSSNYSLYANLSNRVMNIIKNNFSKVEVYSIDEAFIDLRGLKDEENICFKLRKRILKWTGIPVSIGISKTKTLSKVANKVAKKNVYNIPSNYNGVFMISCSKELDYILKEIDTKEIWGIGSRLSKYFKTKNINSAFELKNINEKIIKQTKGVLIEKTVLELKGIKCFDVNDENKIKKSICVSRSFRKKVSSYEEVKCALINYTEKVSEKLRQSKLYCKSIYVFLQTSKYDDTNYLSDSEKFSFVEETNDSLKIWKVANNLLKVIFKRGLKYSKVGIVLYDLCEYSNIQNSVFDLNYQKKKISNDEELMKKIDYLNRKFGEGKVRISSNVKSCFNNTKKNNIDKKLRWTMKSDFCSPCYTTRWYDIPKVNME